MMSAADLEKNNIFYHFHQSIKNAEANVTKCYGKKNSLSRALKGIKIRIDSFVAYIKKGLKKGNKFTQKTKTQPWRKTTHPYKPTRMKKNG